MELRLVGYARREVNDEDSETRWIDFSGSSRGARFGLWDVRLDELDHSIFPRDTSLDELLRILADCSYDWVAKENHCGNAIIIGYHPESFYGLGFYGSDFFEPDWGEFDTISWSDLLLTVGFYVDIIRQFGTLGPKTKARISQR